MKRALVWKQGFRWHVCLFRKDGLLHACTDRPTHAAALTYALEAVGLATPEQHREAP